MKYTVEYSKDAHKYLRKLDSGIRTMILKWIDKNLVGSSNPRLHGKALAGNLAGLWRYRVGNYRLIAEIQDNRLVILMLEIGHRSEIYH
jgi:mRNA interferase RelE/StbE